MVLRAEVRPPLPTGARCRPFPIPDPADPMAENADLRVRDAARAAALLLDAVEDAPNRTLTTVETAFGRADVILDGAGIDVLLHDRDATVHVRFDPAATAPA